MHEVVFVSAGSSHHGLGAGGCGSVRGCGLEIGALVFAVAPGLGVGESAAAIIIDARI